MPKQLWLLCLFELILSMLSTQSVLAAPKIKVGVIAGFSGDWAAYGVSYRQGIQLANVGDSVQFIYEDDQFSPAKTVTAFRKLVDIDHVDALIVGDTTTTAAIADMAESKKIPALSWASGASNLSGKDYVFRIWPPLSKEIVAYVKVIRVRGYKKIILFASAHDYASAWATQLKAALPDLQVQVEQFASDPSDYRAILLRLKNAGISAIGLCLNPGQNGLFALQAQQLGISIPLFGSSFIEATSDLEKAKGALDGVWFISTKVQDSFRERFLRLTKRTDHLFSAAIHYDAATALSLAAAKTSGSLRDKILALGSFSGAHESAQVVKIGSDQYIDYPLAMYEIKDGEIVIRE